MEGQVSGCQSACETPEESGSLVGTEPGPVEASGPGAGSGTPADQSRRQESPEDARGRVGAGKKNAGVAVEADAALRAFCQRPFRHRYAVGQMLLFVSLVLSSASSLCGASRVIELLITCVPVPLPLEPCSWWGGRFWLLRLGYYKLTRPKEQADDWVWIVDHSVQLGTEKCLLILGMRLSTFPSDGRAIGHADVEPIELLPVTKSTGDIVWQQLEQAVEKTGIPREILSDHGSDLKAGIRQFCQAHPQTCSIYDITHKAATIIKHVLDQDNAWQDFCRFASRTKQQVQQTALAPVAPPNQKTKARYMNVDKLSRWGRDLLRVLGQDTLLECDTSLSSQQVKDKLDWLREFQDALEEWTELFQLVTLTECFVRQEGFHERSADKLAHRLREQASTDRAKQVRETLVQFVREEAAKARPGERLLGSSEVIESVFGKLKQIEQTQAKSGFTGLVLSAAAMVSPTNVEVMQQAMETVSTETVLDWCRRPMLR